MANQPPALCSVRCETCGYVLGNTATTFRELKSLGFYSNEVLFEILDVPVARECCRSALTNPPISIFSEADTTLMAGKVSKVKRIKPRSDAKEEKPQETDFLPDLCASTPPGGSVSVETTEDDPPYPAPVVSRFREPTKPLRIKQGEYYVTQKSFQEVYAR